MNLTENEQTIILDILKILSTDGSYEGGEVRVFEEITKKYGINKTYDELYYSSEQETS
jgi:hypothetical protein